MELDRTLLANSVALLPITEALDATMVDRLFCLRLLVVLPGTSHIYRETPSNKATNSYSVCTFRFIITITPSFDAIGDSPSVVKRITSKYNSMKLEFIY
jgi:hypothetical protein